MGLVKSSSTHLFTCIFSLIFITTFAQERPRILYGLPPLPDDADLIRTTTTLAPIRHHTLPPHMMFTLPPMTPLPALVHIGPFGVNPIPELPPIPESRLDGKYDNDGNFVPNSTPKPERQIVENRVHGVKTEPFATPSFFRQPQKDPHRSYPNVRGVGVVTVAPQYQATPRPLASNQEAELQADEPSRHVGPKNARQWQTTATKLVNQRTAIESPLVVDSIESIDKFIDTHGDNDHDGESGRVGQPRGLERTTQKPSRREIFTTKLLVGALGINDGATPFPLQPPRKQRRPSKVVTPQNRMVKPRRPAPQTQQQFFDYKPKQRAFQPEQKIVTRSPQIRPRIVPNRPQLPPPPVFSAAVPVAPQPLPPIPVILPPQPWNRDSQDAAFLQEVEEYDWRLHYKQQAYQQGAPTATQLRGFNRAQGEVQVAGNPHHADYEDLVAIRNREYFTDNPPQKTLPLPTTTEAGEVLIPFNNAQSKISSSNLQGATGAQQPSPNNGIPNLGGFNQAQNLFNQPNANFAAVTPHPIFGGLFNLFNFNGAQGQQGFLPGFGR